MKKLLSLPPNLVSCFHKVTGLSPEEWYCTNDPVGRKLGSGGGTAWLLRSCYEAENQGEDFDTWLAADRRLLLHAGGQSRRLPAYAPSGKVLTPIPVFRWERGQSLSQDLLSLQVPLYQRIMDQAPASLRTMVVSGDVYIRATEALQPIPDVDVVCYGLWLGPEIAKDHGVFVSSHQSPEELKCMLQKPSMQTLGQLQKEHFYLTDIGIWLFSDHAVKVLMKRAMKDGEVINYDMYGEFGCCLGTDPVMADEEVNTLRVAILPLPGGEFYHFGTSHEIVSSTLAIQNLVNDQREIMHHSLKPHPSMFLQNSQVAVKIREDNQQLWVENSCVGAQWQLANHHIITGVPTNDWSVHLTSGQCVDIVPIGENGYVVRPYGFNDMFRGPIADTSVCYLGQPFVEWAQQHGIEWQSLEGKEDLQATRLFPVCEHVDEMGVVLRWMLGETQLEEGRLLWERAPKLSADEISAQANLVRLTQQRALFRAANWRLLADNYSHSVFYQIDLDDAAHEFVNHQIPLPKPLPEHVPLLTRIHDAMFRSEVEQLAGRDGSAYEERAFSLLRQGISDSAVVDLQSPSLSVYSDQIVWGRSPVRIDIAGGWTDTPPFSLMEGGNVINFAIELNGQPPLQTFVKPCKEHHIILRSIDLGASEVIHTYEELADFHHVGSPFSIPKAALALAGFLPRFSARHYASLQAQLQAFGSGIEVTLLSDIPAGSGLGTSSLLASTVLGALNDFCGLSWDKREIGNRTLILEQLLTTGGGWQDQFGGLLPGVKLLQTAKGFAQNPVVRWLPSSLFTHPEYRDCHLLYYTGITRTAKTILAEIVRKMFLNQHEELALLREMKRHTMEMFEAIQRARFTEMGQLVRRTWQHNQLLDSGTNPPEVQQLTALIDDLCLGYKLPGAGGGGYLYMIAKDPEAAHRIRHILDTHRRHPNARFVDMTLSESGLQISRS